MASKDGTAPLRAGIWFASVLLLAGCTQTQTASTNTPNPMSPDTLNVADAAIAGGDPNMALSISQSILSADPGNVDALVHEGDAYYALGRCPASEAAYQLALTHDPKSAAAETGLGRCLLKTDPRSAEGAFILATQDDPGNAAAWNDLGIARDLQGNFAGAVQPYQQALTVDPSLMAAEVNLGMSLALSGNAQEALQYLGPLATGQGATPKIREDYAAALVAVGRNDEARQVLSIDLPPDSVNQAMAGYAALIGQSQSVAPPPPPVATVTQVQTTSVTSAPITQSSTPTPLAPAAAPVPATASAAPPAAPSPAYVQDNSTGAYTGPSPIPGAVSSSTPGAAPTQPADPPSDPPPVKAPPAVAPAVTPAVAQVHAQASPPAAPVMAQTQADAQDAPAQNTADSQPASGASIQLGALNSPDDAERAWRNISGATPTLFSGKEPSIEPATINGKTYYRLRVGGFDKESDAAKFCGEVSAAGDACTVADF